MKKNLQIALISVLSLICFSACSNHQEEDLSAPNAEVSAVRKAPNYQEQKELTEKFYMEIHAVNNHYEKIILEHPEWQKDNGRLIHVVRADVEGVCVCGGFAGGLYAIITGGVVTGGVFWGVLAGASVIGSVVYSLDAADKDENVTHNEVEWRPIAKIPEESIWCPNNINETYLLFGQLHNQICQDVLEKHQNVKFSKIPKEELYSMVMDSYTNWVSYSVFEDKELRKIIITSLCKANLSDDKNNQTEFDQLTDECWKILSQLGKEEQIEYAKTIAKISSTYNKLNADISKKCTILNGAIGVGIYSGQFWKKY